MMIRKILLASVALCSVSAAASAADLPTRVAEPVPAVSAPPVFTWTGFYVGVNAGGAWKGHDSCPALYSRNGTSYVADTTFNPNCDNNNNPVDFIGGGQAGFNWQTGAFVFGVEGDIDWLDNGDRHGFDYTRTSGDGNGGVYVDNFRFNGNRNGSLLSTVRGRLGFAVNHALFYVTGGAAFRGTGDDGNVVWNYTHTPSGGTTTAYGPYTYTRHNDNNNNVGWALGGGLEYAFTQNLTVKAEYIHAQFGNNNGHWTSSDLNAPNCDFIGNRKNSIDTVRVGVNFLFGAPAPAAVSPVTARY